MSQGSSSLDGSSTPSTLNRWSEFLLSACESGVLELAQFCVDKGADVDHNGQERQGMTALHIASAEGHVEIASFLLSKGARVDSGNSWLRTPLSYACRLGYIDIARLLLHYGANIEHKDKNNQTPLHAACLSQEVDITKLLIDKGCSLDAVDNNGDTPLHLACETGNSEIVKALISGGADFNLVNGEGVPPILIACFNNHTDTVMTLIELQVNPNTQSAKEQCTILHHFAKNGPPELVDYLLHQGADFNTKDCFGNTPLHYACRFANLEVTKLLINSGAEAKVFNNNAQTPLHMACQSKDKDKISYLISQLDDINVRKPGALPPLYFALSCDVNIVEAMIKAGADMDFVDDFGQPLFHYACQSSDREVVNLFIKSGADPNGIGLEGKTHLHVACESGLLAVIQLLVESGANVNATDSGGRTPMHIACMKGRLDVVKFLHEKTSNCETRTNDGVTPLIAACKAEKMDVIKYLVENQADITAVCNDGSTVLHAACCGPTRLDSPRLFKNLNGVRLYHFRDMSKDGPMDIIKYLIIQGADNLIDQIDHQGRTCLDLACMVGHTDVVSFLIRFGADVEKSQQDYDSPLIYASIAGHTDIVRILICKGANVNKVDIRGFTPLHFACAKGHVEIVKILICRGANPDIITDVGETAMELAEKGKHADIATILQSFARDPNATLAQLKDDISNISEPNEERLQSEYNVSPLGGSNEEAKSTLRSESITSPVDNVEDVQSEDVATDTDQLTGRMEDMKLRDTDTNRFPIHSAAPVTDSEGNNLPNYTIPVSNTAQGTGIVRFAQAERQTMGCEPAFDHPEANRDDGDDSGDFPGGNNGNGDGPGGPSFRSRPERIGCRVCGAVIRGDQFFRHLVTTRKNGQWCDSRENMIEHRELMKGWTRIRNPEEVFNYSIAFEGTGPIGTASLPFFTGEYFNFNALFENAMPLENVNNLLTMSALQPTQYNQFSYPYPPHQQGSQEILQMPANFLNQTLSVPNNNALAFPNLNDQIMLSSNTQATNAEPPFAYFNSILPTPQLPNFPSQPFQPMNLRLVLFPN